VATVSEARELLRALGLPSAQQTEIAGLTLLVLAGLRRESSWSEATPRTLKIHDIIGLMDREWSKHYAENTRETVRRQVLHQLEQARIVDRNPDDPALSTNSPRTHYRLAEGALAPVRAFGGSGSDETIAIFRKNFGSLDESYRKDRGTLHVPITLPDGKHLELSPGAHNELQRKVVEQFLPTFLPGASVVYLGDAAEKGIHLDKRLDSELRLSVSDHGKLPDIIAWDPARKLLILVEAVTSHGPVSPKRERELKGLFADETRRLAFITAFDTFAAFREHSADIAWETEVWIA
jgi:hypothetical protein